MGQPDPITKIMLELTKIWLHTKIYQTPTKTCSKNTPEPIFDKMAAIMQEIGQTKIPAKRLY